MIELASIQPAKPGSGDRAYSGLHGVWYKDRNAEEGTKPLEVFFAVTYRLIVDDSGVAIDPIVVTTYIESAMQRWIDWHKEGAIQIDPLSIRPDPADQRPTNEQTQRRPPAEAKQSVGDQNAAPPNSPAVKTFDCVKIEKERDPKSKTTYIGLYAANHQYPDVRVKTTDQMWGKLCDQLHPLTNVDWKVADLGLVVDCNLVCGYTDSKNTTANGNPYKNFYGIRAK